MLPRIIAVLRPEIQSEAPALAAALNLAREWKAHARCLHFTPDPRAYAVTYGDGVPVYLDSMLAQVERESNAAVHAAMEAFSRCVEENGLALSETPLAHQASACFQHASGEVEALAARACKYVDMVVAARQYGKNPAYDAALAGALFGSGRPVLFIPEQQPQDLTQTIVIAWNGSLEAARAVQAALPLLKQAARVYILTVQGKGERETSAADALIGYLCAHGISAQASIFAKEKHGAGEMLLAKAAERKATLLVMGAFSHSRMRERLFGGVTRALLEHAPLPLFMMH